MQYESREERILSDEAAAGPRPMSRRDALTAAGLAGATALSTGALSRAQAADEKPTAGQPKNPYGGVPRGGIKLPPYYRPTPNLASANVYYPGQEELGPDEMRVSFLGCTPIQVTRSQAGTCIMVELGNGKRFFFDLGSGCVRNIITMAVPLPTVNDIFFTHLHVDHYADLPYTWPRLPGSSSLLVIQVHRSEIATSQARVVNWKILVNQWGSEHSFHDELSHHLVFTKNDDEPTSFTSVGSDADSPEPLHEPG